MPGFLKQATASQSRALGPFVDDTDFKTPETGLTIANTDIKLVVNGGASANKNSGGGTHRINGVYGVTFDATDTATVGEMEVSVVVAGALPVFDKFFIVEEAVYDALYAAAAPGYLQPTTAGRTLDVSATGEAGVDWANVGSPTTTVGLSGTTVKTATDVETDTQDIQTRLPAALVTGRIDASVGAVAANAITAAAIATDAIDADALADGAITALTFAAGAIDATAIATDAIGSAELAVSAITEIQAGLSTLDAAGVRAAVGLASANLDTQLGAIDDYLDTEVAAIKAKTDSLTFTVAGVMDSNVLRINGNVDSPVILDRSARGIVRGTVGSASTTTSIVTSSLVPGAVDADQFKGRIVTFDLNTSTSGLRGQATDITANTTGGVLSVTALTQAPTSGDTFTIN